MALRLVLRKGGSLAEPFFPADGGFGGSHALWLVSGRLLQPPQFAAPFLCWDGQSIASNLPGTGLRRNFHDLTIHCSHQPWHAAAPAIKGRGLWLPSCVLNQASYHDGPVLGRLGSTDGPIDFMLPLGRYSYDGPLAPSRGEAPQWRPAEAPDELSPRHLRAPLSQAVTEWLRHRFAPGLGLVTIDPAACPRRQALALIYLKMAGFFNHLAIAPLPTALSKDHAKGFRALARNLGCFIGKSQPPEQLADSSRLSLSDLDFFIADHLIDATIADFNSESPLVPKAFSQRG